MATYPDCEICGEEAGQHAINKGGDRLRVCTHCMLQELGEVF